MSEVVDRFGEVVLVVAPSKAELIRRYREDPSTAAGPYAEAAASLGLRLLVLYETYSYVARWVLSGAGGLREGAGKLSEGAAQLLSRALREDAPTGSTLTLSPDCLEGIRMPARSR